MRASTLSTCRLSLWSDNSVLSIGLVGSVLWFGSIDSTRRLMDEEERKEHS